VDRGKHSLETICLLLSLKTLYPKSFFMIRGNHESERMNKKYGFQDEIKQRYRSREADRICDAFRDTFDCIPIAAVIDEDIFCCHGGIGPGLVDLDQIRRLKRPITLPPPLEWSWVTDVLWSGMGDRLIHVTVYRNFL
jgi:serine/threonine-protein phosphatase PP1 catalytic subunit